MTAWAIVVAAGEGTRLSAGVPKALVPLAGIPILAYSLDAIARCDAIAGCVVACGESWKDVAEKMVKERFLAKGRVAVGGASRQESVRNAIARVPSGTTAIVVHDAARPLADSVLFTRAVFGLERAAGAVCAVPVADTIKQSNGDVVTGTVDRSRLWRAQTPQAFRLDALVAAHDAALRAGFTGTDDAALLERVQQTVIVVPGDERNIKITVPADLAMAEALLEQR